MKSVVALPKKLLKKLPIKLTPTEKKILEVVSVNPNITQAQLVINIGITSDGIR